MVFGFFKKKKPQQAQTQTQGKTDTSPQKTKDTKGKNEAPVVEQDMGDDQWIYDTVIQFLSSPTWQVPILSFIDDNCIIFDDEEENKFEYTQVHEEFKKLVEGLMDDMISELEISEEKLMQIMQVGLKHPEDKRLFEQLLIIDNFLVFKNLMIKRNKQLELEALQQIQEMDKVKNQAGQPTPGFPEGLDEDEIARLTLEKEQAEIEHAIALSLAVEQEKMKMSEQEDYELQEALRISQADYHKQQQERETERQKQLELEKQKQLEMEALQREKEKAELAKQQVKPKEPEQAAPKAEPVEEQKIEINATSQIKSKKLEPLNYAPKLNTSQNVTGGDQNKGSFLPPLRSDTKFEPMTLDQLLQEKDKIDNKIQQIKQEEIPVQNETLEERKKRLKAQRDLILAKKKAEREAELKNYEAQKESAPAKTGGEAKVSGEEVEKRKEVYQKLKSEL